MVEVTGPSSWILPSRLDERISPVCPAPLVLLPVKGRRKRRLLSVRSSGEAIPSSLRASAPLCPRQSLIGTRLSSRPLEPLPAVGRYPQVIRMIQRCSDARAVAGSRGSEADTSPLICVKEAAHWLGVSKSTVYRLDRVHGPFRFVVVGRRIYVDLHSFDIYRLSRLEAQGNRDSDPVVEAPAGCQAPNAMDTTSRDQCSAYEPSAKESGCVENPGRSGQRLLVIEPRHSAFIATLIW